MDQLLYLFRRLALLAGYVMTLSERLVSRFHQSDTPHLRVWLSGQPLPVHRSESPPYRVEPPDQRSGHPLLGNLLSLQIFPPAMNDPHLLNQFLTLISSFWRYLTAFGGARTGSTLRASSLLQRTFTVACVVLGLAVNAQAQYTEIDLKLKKTISNAAPAIGEVVTYTIAVTNAGSGAATGVVVSESMTAGLSTFLSSTASVGTFTFTNATSTGSWTIGSVNPGQTVTLLIRATVTGEGVSFNSAEIAAMNGIDVNSTPGNGSLSRR